MSGNVFDSQSKDTSTRSPWRYQADFITGGFQGAKDIYDRGPYKGPFIAQESPWTVQARQALANTATDPNSLSSYSKDVLASTIRGDYMRPDSNPYLAAAVNDALGQAKSAFAGQYAGAAGNNIFNSGYQEALAEGLGRVATNAYLGNYNAEREKQLSAISAAPTFDTLSANLLFGAGQSEDQRRQAEVAAQQMEFNSPWNNLANYLNAIKGDYGATVETPFHSNWLATLLGAAGAGYGMYRGFSGGSGA